MADQMQPSESEIAEVRAKVQQIKQRSESDPSFKQKLDSDLVGTLQGEGLPEGAIAEIARNSGQDEVAGYTQYQVCYYVTYANNCAGHDTVYCDNAFTV